MAISAMLSRSRSASRAAPSTAGVREQDEELLAAEPAGEVAVPQHGLERRADRGQHLVALAVAVLVVDLLEVVQVEHDHGERCDRAVGLGDHPLEGVLASPACWAAR